MSMSPSGVPEAAEYGQLIAFIARKSNRGVSEVRSVLGNGPDGRTRAEIFQAFVDWQQTFQKVNG